MTLFLSRRVASIVAATLPALLCYLVITSVPRNDHHCPSCEITDGRVTGQKAVGPTGNPSPLKIYSLEKFAQRRWMFPIDSKLCVLSTRNVVVSSRDFSDKDFSTHTIFT